jgi:hypothetical protein
MRMTVQPGKRFGFPKTLFDRPPGEGEVEMAGDGSVVLSFVADDIYASKATRRFSITFNRSELDMIRDATGPV